MSERKNIDRLFQERFKDFEAEPPENSWEKIEARLEEKRSRKVIPFWFKLTGVAAVLLIGLFVVFNYQNDSEGKNSQGITVAPDKTQKDSNNLNPTGKGGLQNPQNAVVASPDNAKSGSAEAKNTADPSEVTNGSNASGIRQANSGVAVYPAEKKVKTANKSRVSGNAVAPSTEDSREQYAVTGKGKKNGVSPESQDEYQAEQDRVAQNSDAIQKKSKSAKNNGKVNQAGSDLKSGTDQNTQIAQNGKSSDDKKIQESNTKEKIAVNENRQSGSNPQNAVTEQKTTSTDAIAAKTDDIKTDSTGIATVEEPNALEELLNEKENKSVTQNEPKINRWQITSKVAPIYSSSAAKGSPIDSRFAQNDKEYKTKMSYGMGVSYSLNNKLSVRAGVNALSFETNTTGVVAQQTAVGRQQLEHVKPTLQGAFLRIENKAGNNLPELGSNGVMIKKFDSSINQKTGYIEVPLELSYKVIDKRFGVDVIGGFSTMFLNENEVSVVTASNQMEVGKASNLNNTSFSGNLGIGVRYNLLKALQVNVEPMFKYQFNTYTEAGSYKPYFFGIYTGLNYRF